MDAIILGVFSFLMVLLCVVLVLFVLMQKPNSDGGMGASLGGGAAESAFGGEASNVLTKFTVKAVVLYFVLAFCLYLGYIYASSSTPKAEEKTTTESVLKDLSKIEETPAVADVTAISEIVVDEPKTEELKAPATETTEAIETTEAETTEVIETTEADVDFAPNTEEAVKLEAKETVEETAPVEETVEVEETTEAETTEAIEAPVSTEEAMPAATAPATDSPKEVNPAE